jgi:hypothetical protein
VLVLNPAINRYDRRWARLIRELIEGSGRDKQPGCCGAM